MAALWISSCTVGQLLGVASPPRRGTLFVFSCIVAFCPLDATDDFVYRASYEGLTVAVDDISKTLRLVVGGVTFKISCCEELDAAARALEWITTSNSGQCSVSQRAEIMFPQATATIESLAKRLPEPEYVIQELDGAIVTNQRMFFATSVVLLREVEMMHMLGDELKIIVNRTLVLHLKCSAHRQNLIVSVWLAAIPVESQFVASSAKDPQTALKSHVRVLQQLHRQFCAIDISRDGVLSLDEVANTIGYLFRSRDFVPGFFRAIDNNSDQVLSLQEFVTGMCGLLMSDPVTRLNFALRIFDRDGDNQLTEEEVALALELLAATGELAAVTEEPIRRASRAIFESFSHDCSDLILIEELMSAFRKDSRLRDILRVTGLSDETPLKVNLVGECPSIAEREWFVMTTVMQVLLVGLGAPTDLDQTPNITKKDFTDVFSGAVNVDEGILAALGSRQKESLAAGTVDTYAPRVFEKLRTLFALGLRQTMKAIGVDKIVARMLLGSDDGLVSQSGLSGLLNYVSRDNTFLIRSVPNEEKAHLLLTLPQYVAHLTAHPCSLLPRCIGLFTTRRGQHQLHLAIFLNIGWPKRPPRAMVHLQPIDSGHAKNDALHESDLKGKIELARGWREPLVKQIKRDIGYLEANSFVGYSLQLLLYKLPRAPNTSLFSPEFLREALAHARSKPKRSTTACCSNSGGGTMIHESPTMSGSGILREGTRSSKTALAPNFFKRKGHAAASGGMFFQCENGLPGLNGEPILVSFLRPFSMQSPHAAATYGENLLKVAERCLGGEEDTALLSHNIACGSIRQYEVSTETGKLARIGVDQCHRQLILAGAGGESLLVLNLVLACPTLSFVRDFPSFTDISKRLLTVRSGMRCTRKDVIDFDSTVSVAFDSYPAREAFLAEVHQVIAADGKQGMHVFESQIYLVAWDMSEAMPGDINSLFEDVDESPADGSPRVDIVCVSVQHCSYGSHETSVASCEGDWLEKINQALKRFEKVHCVSLWSNRIAVFVRESLLHQVSNVATATTASVIGNRGAAAIQMMFFDTSLLFVGVEFAQRHDGTNSNEDYFATCEGLQSLGLDGICALQTKHHVFFLGDLKYRVARSFKDTVSLLGQGLLAEVAKRDELSFEMKRNKVFVGFWEPPLTFPPNGKFLRLTDGTKPRVYAEDGTTSPAWSTRILYKSLGHRLDEATCFGYQLNTGVRSSDFSPVCARYAFVARQQYVCRPSTINPVIALNVSNMFCKNLDKPSRVINGSTSVRLYSSLFVQSFVSTRSVSSTAATAWEEPLEVAIHACEVGLVSTNYISFVVMDKDLGTGRSDVIGTAVASLAAIGEGKLRLSSLPIMHHGCRNGIISVEITVKVAV